MGCLYRAVTIKRSWSQGRVARMNKNLALLTFSAHAHLSSHRLIVDAAVSFNVWRQKINRLLPVKIIVQTTHSTPSKTVTHVL